MTQPFARKAAVLALIFVSAGLLTGCGRNSKAISGQIPDITLKTHQGETFMFTGQGKDVTLLVFWATWCGPCLMEIPSLVVFQEKYRDRNFRVVSIIIDDPEGVKARPLVSSYGINYPILLGSEETTKLFGGIVALPTSFLVGKDGRIKEKVQGLLPQSEMERKIEKALAGTT